MQAYLLRRRGVLEFAELPTPKVSDGELLLQTESVSVCATDVAYFRGYKAPPALPIVLGHEYLGRVVENRSKYRDLTIGHLVSYWGQSDFEGLAEFRVIRPVMTGDRSTEPFFTERGFVDDRRAAVTLVRNPSNATLLEPLTAVLRAIYRHLPMPGDRALVLGAGTCGLLALQALRLFGCETVDVLECSAFRRTLAIRCGARMALDPKADAVALSAHEADSQGAFVDYAFDALPDLSDLAVAPNPRSIGMRLLRPGGRYVLFGAAETPQPIDTWLMLSKGLRLSSSPFDVREFPMWRTAAVLESACRLVESGAINLGALVTHEVEFNDEAAVLAAFHCHGADGRLKTVARVGRC